MMNKRDKFLMHRPINKLKKYNEYMERRKIKGESSHSSSYTSGSISSEELSDDEV